MGSQAIWIVAADARRARIFEERVKGARLIEREFMIPEVLGISQIEPRDRPPRIHESAAPARHAQQRVSPADKQEHAFLRQVALHLDAGRRAKAFKRLCLFAPPHALGVLRDALSEECRSCLDLSVHKDMVRLTDAELTEALKGLREAAATAQT